jgi:hypothetical protein
MKLINAASAHIILAFLAVLIATAQDPTGSLDGTITDPSGGRVPQAQITLRNEATDFSVTQQTGADGSFRVSGLPVGTYDLRASASGFQIAELTGIRVDVNRIPSVALQLPVAHASTASVSVSGATIDVSPTLGNVVSGREAVDLPLNGRNLTQLGLLQPGVAPMTFGILQAGGVKRQGQAYAVNGQRPESNNYFLDGVPNLDSVNGGFALRTPPDAVAEFRILTADAPAEYGETTGAVTAVITKSGGNTVHGSAYDFLRNDAFDARNFFAASTEPLHQNQFGATLGGPLRRNRDFLFGFYEGQRSREGETRTAIVPTPAERAGDFSGTGAPLINGFTGQRVQDQNGNLDRIPTFLLNPISLQALNLIPLGNLSPSLYSSTQIFTNNYDQGGFRFDHYFENQDQTFVRYATSGQHVLDRLPINGSNVPGFPTANDFRTHSATASWVHLFSPNTVQTARVAFFRNDASLNAAQNHTPASSLGFNYAPTLPSVTGLPFLIVSGYSNVGNPITGPQNTVQNDYQAFYSLATTRGAHSLKFGASLDRQQINVLLGIATNGFFVFAPFPLTNSFASFLVGQPVTFFQGGGDFNRGIRKWVVNGYVQDEWRVTRNLTLSYGLRYGVNTPYVDIGIG